MARKTALQKTRAQLQEAIVNNRNVLSALQLARSDRNEARDERAKAEAEAAEAKRQLAKFTEVANAHNRRQMARVRSLFNIIFDLSISGAKRDGYIDRVREIDKVMHGDTAALPAEGFDLDHLREEIATGTERTVGRILDGIDTETLDSVLGRQDADG